ncbi:AraC family transcriptional regulator ligand-binding domain-containing protein [Emcibacter sp. SYSU 3D8]|uniref:AraC family transcriptional regulator n=1 Tax=Emcibacter sp. SYSU 3D8 TaxID=3133969 RepID=UPI0031FF08FA
MSIVALDDRTANAGAGSRAALVRIESLRLYPEVVRRLGGKPEEILAREPLDIALLDQPGTMIPYRKMIRLLHRTAIELERPDFGLLLASRQGGAAVLGPLEVAMTNAATLGDAYRYCAQHLNAYSSVGDLDIDMDSDMGRVAISWGIHLDRLLHHEQAIEHGIALMHHAILTISGGAVRAKEIWFAHDHVSAPEHYAGYFGARVQMNAPFNAVFLNRSDLAVPISNRSQQLFEMATSFIDTQFPDAAKPLSTKVRSIATRLLPHGGSLHLEVASALGMHPRTMQRRLRDEGVNFEEIKDEVRRDAAIRYLGQPSIPLTRVAAMLGYSEPSVLTRSCYRWFGSSPRKYRKAIAGTA